MNKEETIKRLDGALKCANAVKEVNDEVIREIQTEIAQLSEAEKPKLRHLDVCLSAPCKDPFMVWKDKVLWLVEGSGESSFPLKDSIFTEGLFLFNLADDLTALQEPLEEWETRVRGGGKIRIKCYNSDEVEIKIDAGKIAFASGSLVEMEEIRKVLGQVIAFAKRK